MHDFAYARAASVAEAVTALRADPAAKLLAGGQTFLPVLKQRLNQPSAVIDLAGAGLSGITAGADHVRIGAMTTHRTIAGDAAIASRIPGLSEMAGWIGDVQVRNLGTIGGSLANNDPTACYPAAMLGLGATIVTDRREIAADDYFLGMFTTALEPDEVIVAVQVPFAPRSAYEKFRNPASHYAMVGVFVAAGPSGIRVAVTGAGQDGVFRVAAMEAALGRDCSPEALDGITVPTEGLNADIHGSAAYRAHLIGVLAKRAVSRL